MRAYKGLDRHTELHHSQTVVGVRRTPKALDRHTELHHSQTGPFV